MCTDILTSSHGPPLRHNIDSCITCTSEDTNVPSWKSGTGGHGLRANGLKLIFNCCWFYLREHEYNYWVQPILVPIALFTSLSWNGLGARNEVLSGDKRFPSSRFQDFFVYVIALARGQLRINFMSIFKVFTKLPESWSDEGNLKNFENTSEINP